MKVDLYQKFRVFANALQMQRYFKLTRQLELLPFYHVVTETPKPHYKQIGYYRTLQQFEADLEFFTTYYASIPQHEVGLLHEKPVFHLTFDDGVRELYDVVFPILKERGLHASIFLNSDFLDNKALFYRHKIGLLLDALDQNPCYKEVLAQRFDTTPNKVSKTIDALHWRDTDVLDEIASLLNVDFAQYLAEARPYLTTEQVLVMQDWGISFGNHTKEHFNLNELGFEAQQFHFEAAQQRLQKQGIDVQGFAFPFGDYNINTEFFDFIYDRGIAKSFGVSGLKIDPLAKHFHRIQMEHDDIPAADIIKFEYFYYLIKMGFGKNEIKR